MICETSRCPTLLVDEIVRVCEPKRCGDMVRLWDQVAQRWRCEMHGHGGIESCPCQRCLKHTALGLGLAKSSFSVCRGR